MHSILTAMKLILIHFFYLKQAARQHLERLPRRPHPVSSSTTANGSLNAGSSSSGSGSSNTQQASSSNTNSGRDITITSNPLLLAAAAAAASSSSSMGAGSSSSGSGGNNSNGSGLIGFGSAANNLVMAGLQPQSHLVQALSSHSQSLLNRFMQPILDDADLAQLERSRAER